MDQKADFSPGATKFPENQGEEADFTRNCLRHVSPTDENGSQATSHEKACSLRAKIPSWVQNEWLANLRQCLWRVRTYTLCLVLLDRPIPAARPPVKAAYGTRRAAALTGCRRQVQSAQAKQGFPVPDHSGTLQHLKRIAIIG